MRTITVCQDFDGHQAGDHIEVDDQTACDAIAAGHAVPSVNPIAAADTKALTGAPKNRALDSAPEVK